jgi:hypothetical protein
MKRWTVESHQRIASSSLPQLRVPFSTWTGNGTTSLHPSPTSDDLDGANNRTAAENKNRKQAPNTHVHLPDFVTTVLGLGGMDKSLIHFKNQEEPLGETGSRSENDESDPKKGQCNARVLFDHDDFE